VKGLANVILRRRWTVVVVWILLTVFGAFSAVQVSNRWLEQFSIPGYAAYEANQRTLHTFGNGEQAPLVAVFTAQGDVTKETGIAAAVAAAAAANPSSRSSSYFSTRSRVYVSKDGHTTFAEIYPSGEGGFNAKGHEDQTRAALRATTPAGVTWHLTGQDPLNNAAGGSGGGPSVLTEALIGGLGAVIILLFVFGTLPAVLIPILVAIASILNTFTLIWVLTYITPVTVIVQFLVALVGLGVAIDYSLLMIFRFREELAHGEAVDVAIIETMTHAGRSVIVSGSTVAIGLLSMVIIPIPVIRSIGIGGLLIPLVSVMAGITLLPAMLALLGTRINSLRVLPKRMVNADKESPFWRRWANFVMRRPVPVMLLGLVLVALCLVPFTKLNPSDAEAGRLPGPATNDAIQGRTALQQAGISPGVIKPLVVLIEGNGSQAVRAATVAAVSATPGVLGASAPDTGWRKGTTQLVEAFSAYDGSASATGPVISKLQNDVLPSVAGRAGIGTRATLGGVAAESRDFVHAVYDNFPYVLAFVVVLTYLLLMRAFRSLLLPLKAVILNLISLAAAYGIIVFIFQQGHGSQAIWGVQATGAIISWIPLMIFAFLYGLSMDYEVFMLTRMREAYDETGDTPAAISLGLARTGKLVTSAALVLMFAFFVLSTGPSVDIKQFGIGLAAGIIFDATVIRMLLVPSIMRLFGEANWYLPAGLARVLRVRPRRLASDEA
jgi:putative drug exporter of the RND superfamily